MQVKIKYCKGFIADLERDKVYDVISVVNPSLVVILDDVGAPLYIRLSSCAHLNGGTWEVVQC